MLKTLHKAHYMMSDESAKLKIPLNNLESLHPIIFKLKKFVIIL